MDDVVSALVIGVMLGGIYALIALGLNLIFGVIRVVNFAHAELVMLGMYGTLLAVNLLHVEPYVSIVLVVPALFLVGLLIQRFIIQPLQNEHMMQMFATFALLTILQNAVLMFTRGEGFSVTTALASHGFDVADVRVTATRFIVFASVTVLAVLLHYFLQRTLTGKSIRAVT